MNSVDTLFILVCTAMVFLMTPALAFFYGGLVRAKNALNTMMMSFSALGVALIAWVLIGYSLAFGSGTEWIGDLSLAALKGVGPESDGGIPDLLFFAFQGTFFVITCALISGAVVERMRFVPYLLFITAWGLLVYAPVCHWVWGGGWLDSFGALDFAGGAVVHVNAAAGAVVAALVLGKRSDYGRMTLLPHHVPFVLLGAGLLWFGWFGFNAGSALAVNEVAVLAFVNTLLTPSATLFVWKMIDLRREKRATAVGAATAIVVGLVAITPGAGFVSPLSALAIGAVAAIPSYFALLWRSGSRFDDSLDVFAAHGMGGITGALMVGVFADSRLGAAADGLVFGNPSQFVIQAVSVLVVFAYSASLTFAILKGQSLLMQLRSEPEHEDQGLDLGEHGEEAYSTGIRAVPVLDRAS